MNFKKIKSGFDDFIVKDIVVTKKNDDMYFILKVKKCKCSCSCKKTLWIKRINFSDMSRDYLHGYEVDYFKVKRIIYRAMP